jgi:hypothetical protein
MSMEPTDPRTFQRSVPRRVTPGISGDRGIARGFCLAGSTFTVDTLDPPAKTNQ